MGWVVNATPRPLYPRKRDPVHTIQEAGWAPGSVWKGAENLAPPPGYDPRTVQSVASRYTDWAIPDHLSGKEKIFNASTMDQVHILSAKYLPRGLSQQAM